MNFVQSNSVTTIIIVNISC